MNVVDYAIRGTAWIAFVFYIAGEALDHRRFRADPKYARWFTTLGCAALLIHIACAFNYRYGWSHHAAYADTARQIAALTGWNSGSGIYINYLFALVWVALVIRLWMKPDARPSAGLQTWLMRGFFLFMFFNGTVVFIHGALRWMGLLGCLALIAAWLCLWPKIGPNGTSRDSPPNRINSPES